MELAGPLTSLQADEMAAILIEELGVAAGDPILVNLRSRDFHGFWEDEGGIWLPAFADSDAPLRLRFGLADHRFYFQLYPPEGTQVASWQSEARQRADTRAHALAAVGDLWATQVSIGDRGRLSPLAERQLAFS